MCILSFFGKQEIYQIFSTGNGDWRSKKITSILVSKTHTDRIQLSYLMTERNYTARNRGCLNFRLDMNLNWSKRAVVCANFDGISFWGYAPVFSRRVFYQHDLTSKNHEVKSTSAKLFSLLKTGKTKCGLCVFRICKVSLRFPQGECILFSFTFYSGDWNKLLLHFRCEWCRTKLKILVAHYHKNK